MRGLLPVDLIYMSVGHRHVNGLYGKPEMGSPVLDYLVFVGLVLSIEYLELPYLVHILGGTPVQHLFANNFIRAAHDNVHLRKYISFPEVCDAKGGDYP